MANRSYLRKNPANPTFIIKKQVMYFRLILFSVFGRSYILLYLERVTNTGKSPRWKAILTTSDANVTPTIDAISITYFTRLDAPTLTSPSNGADTNDNTPDFTWSSHRSRQLPAPAGHSNNL